MNYFKSHITSLFLLVLMGLIFFSCVPQQKIKYLQDPEGAQPQTSFENKPVNYRLQPGDYLYIRLFSMDEDANKIFGDMSGGNASNSVYEQSVYLFSYPISDSGYINFPLFGKIKAAGLLVSDVERELSNLMLKEVNNPGVIVKLVNFKITILGEVKNPGEFTINQDRISIFQAISKAGDLTTYSNRNTVRLLRKVGSTTTISTLDLTQKDILTSEFYYLRPGDILYIEPLKSKQYAFESFPYGLILSSLSTVLALLTFFKI
jgi:polysaccharide export outer membrane protein